MTTDEAIRTEAARGTMSPRMQMVKSVEALEDSYSAIVSGLIWRLPNEEINNRSLTVAADKAQLASDLLRALAQKTDEEVWIEALKKNPEASSMSR
jgi:type IV secretory pathway protease TraF